MHITEIWIHPVKSLQGIQLDQCLVDDYGFQYDRQYMLVAPTNNSSNYKFFTQRQQPKLALVQTAINKDTNRIELYYPPLGLALSTIPLDLNNELSSRCPLLAPDIWGLKPESRDITDLCPGFSDFFSQITGNDQIRLVAPSGRRKVTASTPSDELILSRPGTPKSSFQDYFPGNIISQKSLDDLQSRVTQKNLGVKLSSQNFRPNLVVSDESHDLKAWDEDDWKRIRIGEDSTWYVPCRNIRCQIPTINLCSGEFEPSHEPYKTLQSFRRIDKGMPYFPCFGMNLVNEQTRVLVRVGDSVSVLRRGEHFYQDISKH